MHPEGIHILQVAYQSRVTVGQNRILQRLLSLYLPKPFAHIAKRSERDATIRTLYKQGIDLHQLATQFNLSYSRVYQIAYGRKKSNKGKHS